MRYLFFPAAAILFSLSTPLAADQCKKTGKISGQVMTVNFSDELQYGVTQMTITKNGDPHFSGRGVIIGQVVGVQDNGLPILDHTIAFSDGTRLATQGDAVISFMPTGKTEDGVPCEFAAVEHISSVRASNGLKRLSGNRQAIDATGTVSYCSDDNRNTFTLSGEVCFDR